jgi:hypothetical protein
MVRRKVHAHDPCYRPLHAGSVRLWCAQFCVLRLELLQQCECTFFHFSISSDMQYGSHGLKPRQLVGEYVMGTTMECVTTIVLLAVNLRLTRPRAQAAASKDTAHELASMETN